jgi:hypothetical protein
LHLAKHLGHSLKTTQFEIMKRWKLVILVVVLLVALVSIYGFNPKYNRSIEYRNHKVIYQQYLRGKKFLYDGHYMQNSLLIDQAYMKLANKLLDEYLQTNDTSLIKDIIRISNEHNLRHHTKTISIDSLTKNRSMLLDTMIYIF